MSMYNLLYFLSNHSHNATLHLFGQRLSLTPQIITLENDLHNDLFHLKKYTPYQSTNCNPGFVYSFVVKTHLTYLMSNAALFLEV